MSHTPDGGPAFPFGWQLLHNGRAEMVPGGISVRDYFAAKLISEMVRSIGIGLNVDAAAACAYAMADAMLRAREQ